MLSLTPRSLSSLPHETPDPSGISGTDPSDGAGAAFSQSGVDAPASFQSQLSAAIELGKSTSQASQLQKGTAASTLSTQGAPPADLSDLVGKDLPPVGTPLPQSLKGGDPDPIPRPSDAQAPFPLHAHDSPAVAQLSPGFSEPSDEAIPPSLAARFAKNPEQSKSEEIEEPVAISPLVTSSKSPLSASTEPSSQSAAGKKRLRGKSRTPSMPDAPTDRAVKLNTMGLAPEGRPDTTSEHKTVETRQGEIRQTARSVTRRLTATPVPPLAPTLTPPAEQARDAKGALTLDAASGSKARKVIATPQKSGLQRQTASPLFEAALPTELNDDKSASPKSLTASLASSPNPSSSAPSGPTTSPAVAAPASTPAPVSLNAPAVASSASATPHALVERYVEQFADAREAGRAIRPELTLRHSEFGPVGLRIDAGSSSSVNEWRAILVARDPGFAPAVQAALAERISAASESGLSHNGAFSQRGNDHGSQPSGSNPSGHSGSQSPTANAGQDQRYGSSTGEGQGSAKPYSGEETLGGSNSAAADNLDTDTSDAADGASGTPGALFA